MKIFLVFVLTALLLSCSSTTPIPLAAQVQIKGFLFHPEMIQVPVGTSVVWTNEDDIMHSVTQGIPPTPLTGGFDSIFFTLNQTYSFTFQQPGNYSYFCKRHNHMVGVIHVTPAP